jgi:hypothetical protein
MMVLKKDGQRKLVSPTIPVSSIFIPNIMADGGHYIQKNTQGRIFFNYKKAPGSTEAFLSAVEMISR